MIGDIVVLLSLLLWPSIAETTVRAFRERTITLMPMFVCKRDREYLRKKCTYARDTDPVNYWGAIGSIVVGLLIWPYAAWLGAVDLWHRL